MFIVKSKFEEKEFDTLSLAMEYAKELGVLVNIRSFNFEVVGIFGVDSIKEGVCPDGVEYTWKKRR